MQMRVVHDTQAWMPRDSLDVDVASGRLLSRGRKTNGAARSEKNADLSGVCRLLAERRGASGRLTRELLQRVGQRAGHRELRRVIGVELDNAGDPVLSDHPPL